jgi:putative membrane protein
MSRTLVLVVDRDNDFGVKGGVQTPAIGLDAISDAAVKLGIADPEDSDVNTVYAAVKVYNELLAEGRDAELALICGDTKVGHRSDMRIADELEIVMNTVGPDRAILISDGAEDEYVYPMISSRIKVDSVKKVYVKQAPGLEGAFYVLTRILRDNDKRKRLLAPIGFVLVAISLVLMVPVFLGYRDTGNLSYIYNGTGIFVVFAIGMLLCIYAYRVTERLAGYAMSLIGKLRSGDLTVIFFVAAVVLFCVGIILGITAASDPAILTDEQRLLIFMSNSLWVLAFAYICNDFGKFLGRYIEQSKVSLGFIVGTMMILAAAFIIQAAIDLLSGVFSFNIISQEMIITEFAIGFAFAFAAVMTQISYKRFLAKKSKAESDALQ